MSARVTSSQKNSNSLLPLAGEVYVLPVTRWVINIQVHSLFSHGLTASALRINTLACHFATFKDKAAPQTIAMHVYHRHSTPL